MYNSPPSWAFDKTAEDSIALAILEDNLGELKSIHTHAVNMRLGMPSMCTRPILEVTHSGKCIAAMPGLVSPRDTMPILICASMHGKFSTFKMVAQFGWFDIDCLMQFFSHGSTTAEHVKAVLEYSEKARIICNDTKSTIAGKITESLNVWAANKSGGCSMVEVLVKTVPNSAKRFCKSIDSVEKLKRIEANYCSHCRELLGCGGDWRNMTLDCAIDVMNANLIGTYQCDNTTAAAFTHLTNRMLATKLAQAIETRNDHLLEIARSLKGKPAWNTDFADYEERNESQLWLDTKPGTFKINIYSVITSITSSGTIDGPDRYVSLARRRRREKVRVYKNKIMKDRSSVKANERPIYDLIRKNSMGGKDYYNVQDLAVAIVHGLDRLDLTIGFTEMVVANVLIDAAIMACELCPGRVHFSYEDFYKYINKAPQVVKLVSPQWLLNTPEGDDEPCITKIIRNGILPLSSAKWLCQNRKTVLVLMSSDVLSGPERVAVKLKKEGVGDDDDGNPPVGRLARYINQSIPAVVAAAEQDDHDGSEGDDDDDDDDDESGELGLALFDEPEAEGRDDTQKYEVRVVVCKGNIYMKRMVRNEIAAILMAGAFDPQSSMYGATVTDIKRILMASMKPINE